MEVLLNNSTWLKDRGLHNLMQVHRSIDHHQHRHSLPVIKLSPRDTADNNPHTTLRPGIKVPPNNKEVIKLLNRDTHLSLSVLSSPLKRHTDRRRDHNNRSTDHNSHISSTMVHPVHPSNTLLKTFAHHPVRVHRPIDPSSRILR
jgi:hypothetical protein